MVTPRRAWARRVAMISALTGGGLTAAAVGQAPGALASEVPAETPETLAEATTATTAPEEAPATTTAGGATAVIEAVTPTATAGEPTATAGEAPAQSSPTQGQASGAAAPEPELASEDAQPSTSEEEESASSPASKGRGRRHHRRQVPSDRVKRGDHALEEAAVKETTVRSAAKGGAHNAETAPGPDEVAIAPGVVAAESRALSALFAGVGASEKALGFYRIPLFLLPIYQAAAIQYGVPWEILAAINEVETDYGHDLNVSSAGAIGWMQFMPATWSRYGVDANESGFADPYNPIDAIFAAARYLHAAGASTDLRGAIFAYNHSHEYVESVLLRAKLIAAYPELVVATLTGLAEGELPTEGAEVVQGSLASWPGSVTGADNATASAVPAAPAEAPASSAPSGAAAPAPSKAAEAPVQSIELRGDAKAPVVAVEDGRVVRMGRSRRLGRYIELRDVYGDLFIYSGLGSIAPRYRTVRHERAGQRALADQQPASAPQPTGPASAGYQAPITLHVRQTSAEPDPGATTRTWPATGLAARASRRVISQQTGKVRLYAHPQKNPDAQASAAKASARSGGHDGWQTLRKGSIVTRGTVLGHMSSGSSGSASAYLRFAVRPAGDGASVNPSTIISNWRELHLALGRKHASDAAGLLGASADDVLLMSKVDLQQEVLSDPGIAMGRCTREDVSSGRVDKHVLAVLAFLSRSGLAPTVAGIGCASAASADQQFSSVEISAVNGIPIAGHQGAGTITDRTIRALLALPPRFTPQRIVSLMRYPGASSTVASPHASNAIRIDVPAEHGADAHGGVAHAARAGMRAPVVASGELNPAQWNELIERIAEIPTPHVASRPSSAAIPDPPHTAAPVG